MLRTSRFLRAICLLLTLLCLAACGGDPVDPADSTTDGTNAPATPGPAITTETPATTVPPAPQTTAPASTTTAVPARPAIEASGKFSSETGSNLEIHIDWSVISSTDTTATIRAEAYLTHYSIWVSARNNGTLKIGNSSQTFSTEAITYDGKAKQFQPLATAIVDVPLREDGTATVEISASWPFWGSYSGIKIDHLTCGGKVTVGGTPAPETTAAPATTTAPATTAAPETPAAPEPSSSSLITELGSSILYQTDLFIDRSPTHFNSVALVRSTAELARLLEAHPACTDATCSAIVAQLSAHDDTYFREHALLLIPMGNRCTTAAPVEIFDVRTDDGTVYVHVRDIAPSRDSAQNDTTRFYLLIAQLPADAPADRTICVVQHGLYYTDSGRYERDYLKDEGTDTAPTIRAYQIAAITP
ncbi:MAG: hypothetical protein E7654_03120 [Ruminococcaceae bacterium]|nr:hypothetical protein [Oscillospiraceae bacterium]